MRLDLIWQIARKELLLFFASPIAYLVLGAFLAITLFVFFWGSAFFARNIADVRPLFEWLPIVLILWSGNRRMERGAQRHAICRRCRYRPRI